MFLLSGFLGRFSATITNSELAKPSVFTNFIKAAFFQLFGGNDRNWIFRNLEFGEKFLEFGEKFLEFSEKFLEYNRKILEFREK